MGLASTGKRRLCTAHTQLGHRAKQPAAVVSILRLNAYQQGAKVARFHISIEQSRRARFTVTEKGPVVVGQASASPTPDRPCMDDFEPGVAALLIIWRGCQNGMI
jgi:hypothetical protein